MLAQMVLRIMTGIKDLVLIREDTQSDLKRLVGARSICLDVFGIDSNNKRYDLEVQRADSGARPKRARYHLSAMDIESLDAGQEFEDLPETYTIFVTENDVFLKGDAAYPIERINLAIRMKMFFASSRSALRVKIMLLMRRVWPVILRV